MSLVFQLFGRGSHMLSPVFKLQHLVFFHCSRILTSMFFFFAVRYSSSPLSKWCHFGHVGRLEPNVVFSLRKMVPMFIGRDKERQARLTQASSLTIRKLLSDRRLESDVRTLLRNPDFFFGDSIKEDKICMTEITSGSVKSEINASSFPIWRECSCSRSRAYGPCLFAGRWTGS